MRKEQQTSAIRIQGELKTVHTPVFDLDDHVIRMWNTSDFEQIASFTDPSLYNQLDADSLERMTGTGYSFEQGKRGIVGFVAEEKRTGGISGRSYVETWRGEDIANPRYRQTEKGVQVITSREQMQGAEKIVEMGGWLVRPDQRGKKLSQALAYASIDFIKNMQEEGAAAEVAFITNVGPLRPRDNPQGINYLERLEDAILSNGYDPSDLRALANQKDEQGNSPAVISPDQFREIFSDLRSSHFVDGKNVQREYRFGDPRSESAPAYQISKKIAEGNDLITVRDENGRRESLPSPIPFVRSGEMNVLHGGSYTLADLRKN